MKIKIRNISLLSLMIFVLMSTVSKADYVDIEKINKNSCDGPEVDKRELVQFKTNGIIELIKNSADYSMFNPQFVIEQSKKAKIVRAEVSSSHIVNYLSDEFERARMKKIAAIQGGQLKVVMPDETYSYDELVNRIESTESYKANELRPVMENMYKSYISALKRKEKINSQQGSKVDIDKMKSMVSMQVDAINNALKTSLPSVIEKIGLVKNVNGNNLPLSYRNGRVVKVRFQKEGSNKHITVYPRMLFNLLEKNNERFLLSLESWKEFCKNKYDEALDKRENKPSGLLSFFIGETENVSDEELSLTKRTFEVAKKDFDIAKKIHKDISALTKSELQALMSLFQFFQFSKYPKCQDAVVSMNKELTKQLKGKKSTAKLSENEKDKVDKLARDIVFYQDIYKSFSLEEN
ncbi:MAG: hypothetical protein HOO06_03825 [Bdellovibrionaceae bacterium]|jgi:hypothetical protein|nr:hypothetical protein [Pseudobdellovibrionaceae bacterium]